MFSNLHPDPSYLNCSAESLALALEERDRYTRAHCDRVSRLANRLGRRCDLDATTLAQLTLAALLHDIGKIGIPDHVLNAPHRLSDEDWRLMQSHSERGERIFAASRHPHAPQVAQLIRHHHEAYDGSGYPDGLHGEHIPLPARILSVADSYDAMTSSRPYRAMLSHAQAMQRLRQARHRQIDPQVFAEFECLMEDAGAGRS
ncbi:HD domain-containing phosphohydrolase [Stenotrophomonas sp. MMGLT7]|uniref:HD-GYP domain-containing protein n=1 Tax=Stenotrophomonas sp. MMGLT7 TaxID=2901227 RepID=UPI001E46840F|nr:HD domain-containing phosphohydrolase [Stenotrophomonas sp. MMGLT7]MCD7099725.1 HD domain-containing protein [Stenotrophomonas sp. MMGLT7]